MPESCDSIDLKKITPEQQELWLNYLKIAQRRVSYAENTLAKIATGQIVDLTNCWPYNLECARRFETNAKNMLGMTALNETTQTTTEANQPLTNLHQGLLYANPAR